MSSKGNKFDKGKDTKAQNKGSSSVMGAANSLKEREKRRRQVFKPVLDNPYTQVNWPFIEPQRGEDIRELLIDTIKPIGVYNEVLKRIEADKSIPPPQRPEILDQVKIGFNDTTSTLESLAKRHQHPLPLGYVFVCKYDISPRILVQHFPVLTYTASKGANSHIKLIQLPKGSAQRLSEALNISDTTILGVSINSPLSKTDIFNDIQDVSVPYLEHMKDLYNKPVINFLSTTAPIGGKKNQQKLLKQQKQEKPENPRKQEKPKEKPAKPVIASKQRNPPKHTKPHQQTHEGNDKKRQKL